MQEIPGRFNPDGNKIIPFPENLRQGIRILIVEDDPDIRSLLLVAIPEVVTGCRRIDAAASAEEAIELYKTRHYEKVVLDWILGQGKTGEDVLKLIRAKEQETNRGTQVIALTAVEKHVCKGVNEYVQKPFDILDLGEKLQKPANLVITEKSVFPSK